MPDGKTPVDVVCGQRENVPLAITVIVTMGVLLSLSLVFVSPGDEAFPIVVIDFVLIVLSLLFFGVIYRYCNKRAMEE